MKPFRDYDLRQVIANQWAAVNKKIDTMSNEEIMANDLECLFLSKANPGQLIKMRVMLFNLYCED